jgi:hypothetical protein
MQGHMTIKFVKMTVTLTQLNSNFFGSLQEVQSNTWQSSCGGKLLPNIAKLCEKVRVVLPLQEQKYTQVHDVDELVPELAHSSNISDHLKEMNTIIQGTIKTILSSIDKILVFWSCYSNLLPMMH